MSLQICALILFIGGCLAQTGMHNMTSGMHNMTSGMHNMTGGMQNMTGDMQNMTSGMQNMTGGMHNDGMHNHEGTHNGMDHSSHTGGHRLFFYVGLNETILFEQWITNDEKSLGLACLYVVLIAIFYEGLKVFRDYLYKCSRKTRQSSYELKAKSSSGMSCCAGLFLHLFQTLLHMIQVFVSLCLMLVFMTFNAYLCVAVVAGAGVGYLLFAWCKITKNGDSDEHCN